jgi:hypothetical protein
MEKLDIWRWAQYTIVGLLASFVLVFTVLPDRGQHILAAITSKEAFPLVIAVVAFGGYIVGMLVWVVTVRVRKVVTWPVFHLFRKLSRGTSSYREYRMAELREQAKALSTTEADVPSDMPDYTHFMLELYRSSEAHPQYLGGKIVSAWQSCTLMLSVLGCLFFGAVLCVARMLAEALASRPDAVWRDCGTLLAFAVLYIIAGLALLERNRILVRDVLMSYVLRRQKTVEQTAGALQRAPQTGHVEAQR